MWISVIYLLAGISCILADAPGDQDAACRKYNSNQPTNIRNFPDNWMILLDTFDYKILYPSIFGQVGSLWMNRDFDGDYYSFDLLGGACTATSYLLCYSGQNQNNSLFSQYINYANSREVYLNATYGFNCGNSAARPCNNPNFVSVGKYPVKSSSTNNQKGDPFRYQPFSDSETNSRLQQNSTDDIISTTMSSIRPRDYNGFYLSVNDGGACGEIRRIIIYYTVCKARQVELVWYPEVPTPPQNAPDELFDVECVPHAHNVTSLQMNLFSANSSCRDAAVGGARCECDNGYEISSNRSSCKPCQAGTYLAAGLSTTCIPCPNNSTSSVEKASMCECQPGYFRSPDEPVSEGCTTSPGKIRNLEIVASNSTTISLSWEIPEHVGGRTDIHYDVCYFLSTCTMTTCELTCQRGITIFTYTTYTMQDLIAFTSYDIFVSAHNGVSEQDYTNADRRIVETRGQTTEGVPNAPTLKRLCTVVIWKPPTLPAGTIIGYDLRFVRSSGAIEYSHASTDNFRITTQEQRDENVLVQIRARNTFNPSQWTPLLSIDCSESGRCPTQLPAVCPTTPTCSTCPTMPACPTQVCPTTPACPTQVCPTMPACPTQVCPTTPACPTPVCPTMPACPAPACPTTPSCPTPVCPTTSACPTPVCPTTPACPTPVCPTMPACPVCPTTVASTGITVAPTGPTLPPPCTDEGNQIWLNQRRFNNGDTINSRDIGVEGAALVIHTSSSNCCKRLALGECFYPDGAQVGVKGKKEVLYRNRGFQLIRLNYLNHDRNITTGLYRCEIPNTSGDLCTIQFHLI